MCFWGTSLKDPQCYYFAGVGGGGESMGLNDPPLLPKMWLPSHLKVLFNNFFMNQLHMLTRIRKYVHLTMIM